MPCQVVMVHYSLLEMVDSSVRYKISSVYVTLGIDSVKMFPNIQQSVPLALPLVQVTVSNQ